jgi:ferredoxin-NADP reductase
MYSLIIRPGKSFKPFEAGQYIELTVQKNGAWMSRFFSISSSPIYFEQTGIIEVSIRIQEGGRITPWLPTALNSGSIVNLSQAMGAFTLPSTRKPILMIAGGSGITPFRSMLQQLSLMQPASIHPVAYEISPITLMYYARSSEHFLFEHEFEKIEKEFPWLTVHLINSETQGLISKEHILNYCPDTLARQVFICGPTPMITTGRDLLQDLHLAPSQIHFEFFGPEPTAHSHEGSANVLFSLTGKQIEVDETSSSNLLDLAEGNEIKPVSGCRIGVCHQCICQKKSGVVLNTKTGEYSDTGHEEIQLCISQPVGDVVLDL